MLDPIPRSDFAESAYAQLRRAILTGTLAPGERLVEDQLASQLGVSRAPIRDALKWLERDGLVAPSGRRGKVVSSLLAHDAWEVYSLRSVLEAAAIRLAIGHTEPALVGQLEAIVEDMRRAGAARDRQLLAEADVRFHETLCRAAQHGRLLQAWESMASQIRRLSNEVIETVYDDFVDVPARHAALIVALTGGDPDAAELAVREHIESVAGRVLRVLRDAEASGAAGDVAVPSPRTARLLEVRRP